jgi:hypothetical protein
MRAAILALALVGCTQPAPPVNPDLCKAYCERLLECQPEATDELCEQDCKRLMGDPDLSRVSGFTEPRLMCVVSQPNCNEERCK